MILQSLEYTEYKGEYREWKLQKCTLGNINLIVGQNASGKTRTLNVIRGLADLLSGDRKLKYISGNYRVIFDNNRSKIKYTLIYENNKIIKEEVDIDSRKLLRRGPGGQGTIYYKQLGQSVDFQSPDNELASFARRDSLQHPFLEDLYSWGKSVRHYSFGTQLGQDILDVAPGIESKIQQEDYHPKDTNRALAVFKRGVSEFNNRFDKSIIKDMRKVGYRLDEIGIAQLRNLIVEGKLPGRIIGLYVKESDLRDRTEQNLISQGMFRALSLIIQITYSQFKGLPSCILIDDIGEGLDYERSSALVKLLIDRVKDTSVQLIMTTNDRFVMNNVPLEYWSLIERNGGKCRIYNQKNSPKIFNDFELTGLNNFDFFSMKYYRKGLTRNEKGSNLH